MEVSSDRSKLEKTNYIAYEWGGGGVQSYNRMTDSKNPYNHLTYGKGEGVKKYHRTNYNNEEHNIAMRGRYNVAPHVDIDLGKKSSTQRIIAEKISTLVSGKGISVEIDDTVDSPATKDQVTKANDILEKGINDCIKKIANGLVYQSVAPIIATQKSPTAQENSSEIKIANTVEHFAVKKTETVRFSKQILNDKAETEVKYHYYHNSWAYDYYIRACQKGHNFRTRVPRIVPLEEYIDEQENYRKNQEPAFFVMNADSEDSDMERFVSFVIMPNEGIFDNNYPLPIWKTNQSVNDIQSEFESSCIRLDYLMNGLHIFAIVNCYSQRFTDITSEDIEQTVNDEFKDKLSIVDNLKKSYNSGRVLIQPLYTDNPELMGKIEIEKVELNFPHEAFSAFDEASKNTILSSWGAQGDLFGITRNEGSNLRSQEGFLRIAIIMMNQQVGFLQQVMCQGIKKILEYYGVETKGLKLSVDQYDSSMQLAIFEELAKDFLNPNEIREKLLGLEPLEDDDLERLINMRPSAKNVTPQNKVNE